MRFPKIAARESPAMPNAHRRRGPTPAERVTHEAIWPGETQDEELGKSLWERGFVLGTELVAAHLTAAYRDAQHVAGIGDGSGMVVLHVFTRSRAILYSLIGARFRCAVSFAVTAKLISLEHFWMGVIVSLSFRVPITHSSANRKLLSGPASRVVRPRQLAAICRTKNEFVIVPKPVGTAASGDADAMKDRRLAKGDTRSVQVGSQQQRPR